MTNKIGKEKINSKQSAENKKDLPFFKFFYFSEILFILGCFFFCMISCTFYLPSLTNYLIQIYNFSVSVASLFFIVPTIFYITCLQFLDLVSKRLGLYGTSSLGLLIISLGCFFLCSNNKNI